MSDMAKQARAAMKAKAKSLTSADPHQKVDSSTWSPPEALNTTAKTGMRPISRRAFKAGGKVEGEKAKCNMGRAPRKSGGSTEAKEWMNAKINRNVKDANEEREGIKHVGGMKKGGRTKKTFGGVLGGPMGGLIPMAVNAMRGKDDEKKRGGRTEKQGGGGMSSGRGILTKDGKDVVGPTSMPATEEKKAPPIPQRPQREPEKGMSGQEASEFMKARKSGGRAKKAGGGDLEMYGKGVSGAAEMMKKAGARAGVPGGLYGSGFTRVGAGKLSPAGAAIPMARMKKGGEAKHPDEKMDIALIKKMVKPEARKGRATGGEVFSGPSYPGKIPGVVPGGREARATGGKTKGKGKTNINIIIAAGKPASAEDMMAPGMGGPTPPPGLGGAPGGVPVPVPAAGGAPGAAPMPMPIPMPMPAAGGAGPMPTPRKDGGRLTKVASSFKDMQAGAGSGEGRLQKTDIAKKHKDAPAFKRGGRTGRDLGGPTLGLHGTRQKSGEDFMPLDEALWLEGEKKTWSDKSYNKGQGPTKAAANRGELLQRKAGGRTYRSYKDMDAGAGSGLGRLEKTEIQTRKG